MRTLHMILGPVALACGTYLAYSTYTSRGVSLDEQIKITSAMSACQSEVLDTLHEIEEKAEVVDGIMAGACFGGAFVFFAMPAYAWVAYTLMLLAVLATCTVGILGAVNITKTVQNCADGEERLS